MNAIITASQLASESAGSPGSDRWSSISQPSCCNTSTRFAVGTAVQCGTSLGLSPCFWGSGRRPTQLTPTQCNLFTQPTYENGELTQSVTPNQDW